jgi:hypothetical protein
MYKFICCDTVLYGCNVNILGGTSPTLSILYIAHIYVLYIVLQQS